MNKIYRLVWNRSLRAPVVASELATRSVSGSSRTKAGPQALTTALAGAVVALLAIPPDAQAIVGITRKAVDGTTCEADADETNPVWNVNDDARCHPAAGTGPSGVGDPGTNIIMYSSQGTTGTEDSIAIGGYLDVWKPASFWGGIDLQGNTISNLKPGEKEGDAATVGQVNKVANDLANIANGGGIKYFRANSDQPDAKATGTHSVAAGPAAEASGNYSTAMGSNAKASGDTSLAVGEKAEASGYRSAAFGRTAGAAGDRSTAMGLGAKANQADSVALGAYAVADRANTVSVGSTTSQRQVVNVAKGTQDTDAVNVSQLKGVTSALGGGAAVAGDGSVTAPSYGVGGKTFNNVGDALGNLDGRVAGNTTAINNINGGAGIKYFRANSGQPDATAKGADSIAIGPNALAEGGYSQATGPTYNVGGKTVNNAGDAITNLDGRVTHNTQAIKNITEGKGVKYFHANSTGEDSVASGAESVAAGPAAVASGNGSVAIGQGAQAQADNSVALGAGSVADKAGTVSVGTAGNERTITHVAAGKADTDAVNVSQLKNSQAGSIRYDAPAPGAAPDYGTLTLGGPNGTGSTVVRNVAAGKAPTDAVNVQQLQDGMAQTLGKANSYTDSRFQQVKEDAWVARREARGGTAAAMAMAGMPQAYLPGANMLSAGVGSFQGEAAMAVGLSGVTDNGRYVYKAQASGNTSGEFGFSVGAGIQW